MPKLNFYDTDAVKAFTLDVLVEGVETRRDLDFERRQSAAPGKLPESREPAPTKQTPQSRPLSPPCRTFLKPVKMASKSVGVTLTGPSLTPWTF